MTYRVLMVGACPYPAPQGSQVLLRNTAEALRKRGHDVRLAVYGHGAEADDGGFVIYRGRRIPGVRRLAPGPYAVKPVLDVMLAAMLRRLVRREHFDVVHAHNYEALIAALAAGKRPIVYHAHNAMADELPHFWPGTAFFGRCLDTTFPRRADFVIAPHAALADYLRGCGCAPEKMAVIPPSMDAALFVEPAPSTHTPPILYLGNLDQYQNLRLLIEAMEHVRRAIPDARLVIGTAEVCTIPGAEPALVRNFDDLRACLATDCIAACPRVSWSGYPIKMLNAMAAGRAVVACRSAAHAVRHGDTGLVVPDNDARAFAGAILELMRDHERRACMGEAGRAWVRRELNPDAVGARVESVYARLLGL